MGLLPFPVFKCIKKNKMQLAGRKLGNGYARAIANIILNND
jgi:hypothetical protein